MTLLQERIFPLWGRILSCKNPSQALSLAIGCRICHLVHSMSPLHSSPDFELCLLKWMQMSVITIWWYLFYYNGQHVCYSSCENISISNKEIIYIYCPDLISSICWLLGYFTPLPMVSKFILPWGMKIEQRQAKKVLHTYTANIGFNKPAYLHSLLRAINVYILAWTLRNL